MRRIAFILLAAAAAFAAPRGVPAEYDPCVHPEKSILLPKDSSYTAPCDSLMILSRKQWWLLRDSVKYYRDFIQGEGKLVTTLDEEIGVHKAALASDERHIQSQDSALGRARQFLDTSQSLLDSSVSTTDRAIKELKRAQWRSYLYAGIACLAGMLAGYLIAGPGK